MKWRDILAYFAVGALMALHLEDLVAELNGKYCIQEPRLGWQPEWETAVVTSDCAGACVRLWIWPEQMM